MRRRNRTKVHLPIYRVARPLQHASHLRNDLPEPIELKLLPSRQRNLQSTYPIKAMTLPVTVLGLVWCLVCLAPVQTRGSPLDTWAARL